MPDWLSNLLDKGSYFMPHGHCYLWIPSLLWMHVLSDSLIGAAYLGISLLLYLLVRKIRLPFSPVFIAFGLFIGLCGLTHFMSVWTVWNPDYLVDGIVKAATAAASVATAIGLLHVKPQIEELVHTARLSEERRIRLETANAELEALYLKVTQLDRLKTEFFANVSHELRTPLTLMIGPAERLLMDDSLTDEHKRQLTVISRNGKRLLRQVNDLLDVAKLEAGKMEVSYTELDIAPWFRRIVDQFEAAAASRHIRCRIESPDSLTAQLDPEMIERVLVNLLSNAFKFTPDGGEIEVVLKTEREQIYFHVGDNGPGIAADQHQKIFKRFHQVDASSTRGYGGTGLGLAIVNDIVDLHAGQVELISAPGSGAKFIVRLPLRAPAAASVRKAADAHPPVTAVALSSGSEELLAALSTDEQTGIIAHSPDRPTVLIVEDNPEMRRFVTESLVREFNVVTAADGQEGLERAIELRPDMIVTDVMMPRMSGDQLVSKVRQQAELDPVPILLLTARADDELRIELLENGAQDYLTKPFLSQELLARSRNLVTTKRGGDRLRAALLSASTNVEALAEELSTRHRQLKVALEVAEVAKEHAQRAGEIKSHFLAMVSHELRTPLFIMSTNIQALARHARLAGPLEGALARLQDAVQQMSSLIEGLLEYTRFESGRIEPHPEQVDGVALAADVLKAHQQSVSPAVSLKLAPAQAQESGLVTDARLLRVILNNLVSNALKFTIEGTVTLRAGASGDRYLFEVHDTGIGIEPADLQRIFLPFEQLEPVRRKSVPGMGLGLALVKQLTEVLRGSVTVESTPAGSVFRVFLPADLRDLMRTDQRRSLHAV